jgi:hypothetical protein
MMAQLQTATVCQICLHPVFDEQERVACDECKVSYHQECWDELGGCATYGCPRMVEIKKAEDPQAAWWGVREKKCPLCAETIAVSSLECPYCHASFDDIRPMSTEDIFTPAETEAVKSYRRRAIWLLVFSVLGFTSPLAFLVGGAWYLADKKQIAEAGTTVRAMVLISLAICVVYVVLLLGGYEVFQRNAANAQRGV